MKLNNAPLTLNTSVEANGRLSKLHFLITVSNNNINAALAAVKSSKIKLERIHANSYGTKTVIYENSLLDILEIAGSNAGYVRVDAINDSHVINGTVELTSNGAIECANDEIFKLSLNLSATVSCDVYKVESPVNATDRYVYEMIECRSGLPQILKMGGYKFLAIPRTPLTTLERRYDGAYNIKNIPVELLQELTEDNPISFLEKGIVIPGAKNLFILNTSRVSEVVVEVTETCYLHRVEVLPITISSNSK